jgi:succinyl-CoA synthetase beta subunit
MNLHEYQSKALLDGLPIPLGQVATTVTQARKIAEELGGTSWIAKAQIHSGGRGKAGGVRYVKSLDELTQFTESLLGKRLYTDQNPAGQPVHQILIAKPCDIKHELYLALLIDRSTQHLVLIASRSGGMEIEAVAAQNQEKILKVQIDPLVGVLPYQARALGFQLGLVEGQIALFTKIILKLAQCFQQYDCSLIEINPLVIDQADQLICLDVKMSIDDNALYRQPKISPLRDPTQEDEREARARECELNYIALEGDIGCMVNGAGLAMATMDLIKLHGGNPANFLDVGGSATQERVSEAFKIILSDQKVKGVLINIFGGIVRCDMIADGIIGAVRQSNIHIPIVVRLEGNNSDLAEQKLHDSHLNLIVAKDLTEAAQKIIDAVKS